MTEDTLASYLTGVGANAATLQHAVRYAIAEHANYPTIDQMRKELLLAFGSHAELARWEATFAGDAGALRDLDLVVLGTLWSDVPTRQVAKLSIDEANTKLPVVETAIIALVAMYGLYLLATGGEKRRIEKTELTEKGWTTTSEVEYADFSEPVKGLASALGVGKDDQTAQIAAPESDEQRQLGSGSDAE